MDLIGRVREEIGSLHEFFVAWFTGAVPNTTEEFGARFLSRFDKESLLIPPAGDTLAFAALAEGVRASYGTNPDFRIAIRDVKVRRSFDSHVVATYEEWQRNALQSEPPDNGRVATVVFRLSENLTWLHVHETWLPPAVMALGPYDF